MRLKIRCDSYYAKIFAPFWAPKHGLENKDFMKVTYFVKGVQKIYNENILFHEGGTLTVMKIYFCEGFPTNHEEK
jgi:hypothetical protein